MTKGKIKIKIQKKQSQKDFWEGKTPCWEMSNCPETIQQECPALRYRSYPCWQIEGTFCKLNDYGTTGVDITACKLCEVYKKWGANEQIQLKLFGKGIDTSRKGGKEAPIQIFKQIQQIIEDTRGQAGALIRVLQKVQRLVGYLPPVVLKIIARDLKVSLSEIYGIISFYSFFSMVPKGKYVIQICMGTTCYVKGGERLLDALKKEFGLEPGGITPDRKFSLDTVYCLGCCGLAPVMAIGENVHRKMKPSEVKNVLSSYE